MSKSKRARENLEARDESETRLLEITVARACRERERERERKREREREREREGTKEERKTERIGAGVG